MTRVVHTPLRFRDYWLTARFMRDAGSPSMNKGLGPSCFSYPSLLIAEEKTARRYRHWPLRFLDAKKDIKSLTNSFAIYTLRIYDGSRIKTHTREARLVAGASCRSGRSRSKQHRPSGAGRAGHQGIFGSAYPIGCRAK